MCLYAWIHFFKLWTGSSLCMQNNECLLVCDKFHVLWSKVEHTNVKSTVGNERKGERTSQFVWKLWFCWYVCMIWLWTEVMDWKMMNLHVFFSSLWNYFIHNNQFILNTYVLFVLHAIFKLIKLLNDCFRVEILSIFVKLLWLISK